MVDDGAGADGVEAGTVGTVNATADIFDTNLSSSNGCDPDGCTAALTRVSVTICIRHWSFAQSPFLAGGNGPLVNVSRIPIPHRINN